MISSTPKNQNGAALLIALVLLAVITVLTVSNMREVTLEGRMTANRAESLHLINATEAALREAEKRFDTTVNAIDKIEPRNENCMKSNVYRALANKPCILASTNKSTFLTAMVNNPLKAIATSFNWKGSDTDAAPDSTRVYWMPYRGTDHKANSNLSAKAYWNTTLINQINPEYGAALTGEGTYFYLITAQANDKLASQSTNAVISLGLNK